MMDISCPYCKRVTKGKAGQAVACAGCGADLSFNDRFRGTNIPIAKPKKKNLFIVWVSRHKKITAWTVVLLVIFIWASITSVESTSTKRPHHPGHVPTNYTAADFTKQPRTLREVDENRWSSVTEEDKAKQPQRWQLIQEAKSRGYIQKIVQPATLPHVWITPKFLYADFDTKKAISGVIAYYYYIQSRGDIDIVVLYNNRTGKKIGIHSVQRGLDLD